MGARLYSGPEAREKGGWSEFAFVKAVGVLYGQLLFVSARVHNQECSTWTSQRRCRA